MKTALASALLYLMTVANSASAGTIGTFEFGNPNFSPFNGALLSSARSALTTDGHTLLDLRNGDFDTNLANVDVVYLPLAFLEPLTPSETSTVTDFLASGGNVIVQADHDAYDAFLAQFGVTTTLLSGIVTSSIISPFSGITSGGAGGVSTLESASPWTFGLGSGGMLLDDLGTLAVLAAENGLSIGSGNLILFGDINQFDGPGNFDGWSKADNAILWRNTFDSATVSAVPLPASLPLLLLGLLGFFGLSRLGCHVKLP